MVFVISPVLKRLFDYRQFTVKAFFVISWYSLIDSCYSQRAEEDNKQLNLVLHVFYTHSPFWEPLKGGKTHKLLDAFHKPFKGLTRPAFLVFQYLTKSLYKYWLKLFPKPLPDAKPLPAFAHDSALIIPGAID